jgi:tetratricopeptide (TPR) repeat protein
LPGGTRAFSDISDPVELAERLHVDAVLTGTFQSDGDRLRVTVALVEGGFISWTDQFDEAFDNLFDMQTRIAQGVARRLGQELTGEAVATLAEAESSSVNAYDYYLQGADYVLAGDQESTELGFDFFSEAVRIDPKLADAHVGIGTVYIQRFWNGWGGGIDNIALAEAAFQQALQLDASNMRATRGLTTLHFYRGQSAEILEPARELTRLGSDNAEALLAAAEAYTLGGLDDVSGPLLRRVLAFDPGNENAAWLGVVGPFYSEDFEAAAAGADSYLRDFGADPYVTGLGAHARARLGDIDGARERYNGVADRLEAASAELGLATLGDFTGLVEAGVFYGRHGPRARAPALWRQGRELAEAALEIDPDSIGLRMFFASFHALLGDQAAFAAEEDAALTALAQVDLSPYQLLYLVGAHAHLGNTQRAVEILRRQLRDGRLAGLGFVGPVAPELVDTDEFDEFRREYHAAKQRLRNRYAPID